MPDPFSWNCCYWRQNQVHPVGHLSGHHQTKEGSVFSPTPLLKMTNKEVMVFASLEEGMSNRKLLKTHMF